MRVVLVMLLTLLTGSATADPGPPRISLITRPPGNTAETAFGHTLLRVDADGDLSTTSDQRVYEFGYWQHDMSNVLGNPTLLTDVIIGLLNGVLPAIKAVAARPSPQARLHEDGAEDLLQLPADALRQLKANLEREFGVGRPSGAPAPEMTYDYRNYTKNCCTELRDRIFAVLPDTRRAALEAARGGPQETLRAAVAEDVDRAIQAAGGALRTVSKARWKQFGPMMGMFGIPETLSSSGQFLKMASDMATRTAMMMPAAKPRLDAAHKTFLGTVDEAPISRWRLTYSPRRLRALLLAEQLVKPVAPRGD